MGRAMEIKQIVYILTIAEEGGITKAANKLFMTQSALDQQLLKLENELGVQLFSRNKKALTLTPAGKVYIDFAKRIVSLKNEAYLMIHDISEHQKGTLTLAFAPERGMEMFMDVYPTFYKNFPQVKVIPQEMGVKRQLDMLQRDEIDLGFIAMTENELPGLVCLPLLQEEFVLLTPANHPLAKKAAAPGKPLRTLKMDVLGDLTYCLMYRDSTQRQVIDPMFKRHNMKIDLFLETASNRANVSMVERGLSCSIVPYFYAKDAKNVAMFRLAERPSWQMLVCYRHNRYRSKAAEHFIFLASQHFQRSIPELDFIFK
jgi:DNA-binding transcriptional LysR family regulator